MVKLFADAFKRSTYETDAFVDIANAHIDSIYAKNKQVSESFFHALAVYMSRINIEQGLGGPFGAVIVAYEGGLDAPGMGIGKPKIIGIGANHVFPNSDPSAHAEMEAYRDAATRKGNTDLGGVALYTSCECCPMCLSTGNALGIKKISYANTRAHAEEIEFSDKLQYDMFHMPREAQMTGLEQLTAREQVDLTDALGDHGAVVLDQYGNPFAYGDTDTRTDPTGVASINAVRAAVKKYAGLKGESAFDLPDHFRLVTRDIPHPAGLITADWARLLRKRDADHPEIPALDSKVPDPLRIIHVTHDYEQLPVMDEDGHMHTYQTAEDTYVQPTLLDAERAVRTEQFDKSVILNSARDVFNAWSAALRGENQDVTAERY